MTTFQIIMSLSTFLLSISGLVFSIYIYKTVSLKSDFKKKQLEVVLKLCDILQDTIINISSHGMHGTIDSGSSGTMWRFFQINSFKGDLKDFSDTKAFLVTQDPDRTYKFIKYCEHPYIPPQIAAKIRRFISYVYDPIKYKRFESFTVLGGIGILEFQDKLYIINDNPVYKNLNSFLEACRDLDNEIHKWLKNVGIKEFNKKEIIE